MNPEICASQGVLRIDFDKTDAGWALLVIDDQSDYVRDLVMGRTAMIAQSVSKGLGEECLDFNAVDNYWKSLSMTTRFEKALILMPWMVSNADGIGSVAFSRFPESPEELRGFLTIAHKHRGQVACLIDIYDGAADRERFGDTWIMLDELGHPEYARAKFTQGGVQLESKYDEVHTIRKEPPRGGYDALKMEVQSWLQQVRGVISNKLFVDSTPGNSPDNCHRPSFVLHASQDARKNVCGKFVPFDCFGVWKWAAQLACEEIPPAGVAHRWLCAKAFQATPTDGNMVPLTAVIAICAGAPFLEPRLEGISSEFSNLFCALDEKTENIDRLVVFGQISLAESRRYGDFAAALRDWLIHPEQFDKTNGRISTVGLVKNNCTATLELSYSKPLPSDIFNPTNGYRGRTGRAWDGLASFSASSRHCEERIFLTFAWTD